VVGAHYAEVRHLSIVRRPQRLTELHIGFGDRLLNEVKKLAIKDVKIKIYAPPERKYSTWIGGSILAGLATFKKMWVSAEEYQEDPDNIHKKSGF